MKIVDHLVTNAPKPEDKLLNSLRKMGLTAKSDMAAIFVHQFPRFDI